MESRQMLCDALASQFHHLYKSYPSHISIAPGRVNLIGEHVDHQGYSVLPAALNHTIRVAIGYSSSLSNVLTLKHVHSTHFPEVTFLDIDSVSINKRPCWSNYVVAALFGLIEYHASTQVTASVVGTLIPSNSNLSKELGAIGCQILPETGGLCLLIDGNIPVAAGVSSSSALVVASTIALSFHFKKVICRRMIAEICANSERYVGTAGGGMDQAAICLSQRGTARLIHFNPLHTESIPLPQNSVLVICNSCVEAPKAMHAATCYNKRVFELKLACFLILTGVSPNETIPANRIPDLTLKYVQEKLKVSLEEALAIAKKHISSSPMSKRQVLSIMGEERVHHLIHSRIGPAVWERNVYFDPLRRVVHVYREAQRVHEFAAICLNKTIDHEEKLRKLGQLLNDADESLSLYFDCGSPELSEITELARQSGAYGSRMTGAGWGGCTVSLVHQNHLDLFMEKMKSYYSRPDRLYPIAVPTSLDDALFAVVPDSGATVFTCDGKQFKEILWD